MSRARAQRRAIYRTWATLRCLIWVPTFGWLTESAANGIAGDFRDYTKARKLREHWRGWRSHPSAGIFEAAQAKKCARLERAYPFFAGMFNRMNGRNI